MGPMSFLAHGNRLGQGYVGFTAVVPTGAHGFPQEFLSNLKGHSCPWDMFEIPMGKARENFTHGHPWFCSWVGLSTLGHGAPSWVP